MVRHVLIPLDGSQLAENALPVARYVIQPDTHITLLTATPTHMDENHDPDHDQHYVERIARNLQLQGYKVETRLIPGDPAEVILKAAEELHVDMIVMSTHGRSGLSRLLFGSVTLSVLETSIVPVLLVPNRAREEAEDTETAPNIGPSLAT